MMKTITVKGVGNVSVKPDLIVVSMNLETKNKDYEKTMDYAAQRIDLLNDALEEIGFEKKSVKTTDFHVRTQYESVKDKEAEILCQASGAKLGELISIDYSWGEINVYSDTGYGVERSCMMKADACLSDIDIEPDDVKVKDTVTFVWEIL